MDIDICFCIRNNVYKNEKSVSIDKKQNEK